MVALIIAWIFGASAFVDGCSMVTLYREGGIDPQDYVANVNNDVERAAATKAAEQYLNTLYDARRRVFPLSVAGMLLGAVMVGFAARAMSGREGARSPLIQVVGVQAVLVIVAHLLTADVRFARLARDRAVLIAQIRQDSPDQESMEKVVAFYSRFLSVGESVFLAVRSLTSCLIIVALTRARSRQFFEAAEGRFSER